jgi:hypothetical protein
MLVAPSSLAVVSVRLAEAGAGCVASAAATPTAIARSLLLRQATLRIGETTYTDRGAVHTPPRDMVGILQR